MWPYIVIFLISTLLFAFASKLKRKQKICLEYLAVFLLCILAGMRASNIGTDTSGYLRPLIENAINSKNINEYWNASWIVGHWKKTITNQFEPGFTLVIFVIARITGSIIFTQTFIQFLIVYPVYRAIKKIEGIPLWFGMLVFDCLLFNHTLNMIRQSIAMSLVLLAIVFWIYRENKKSLFLIFLSCSFHLCGVIGFAIIYIYKKVSNHKIYENNGRIFKNRNFNRAIIIGFAVVLLANVISIILAKIGISRFLMYINGSIKFMPNQLILRLPGIILFTYSFKRINERTLGNGHFYLLLIIYEILVSQLAGVNDYSIRIAQMFTIFDVISYSMAAKYSKHKYLNYMIFIAYITIYWLYYFGFGGMAETVPYIMIT